MSKLKKRIPNRLRKHRKIWGLSQQEVAKIISLNHPSKLCKWEKGTSLPTLKEVLKLSALYKALVIDLYYEFYSQIKEEIKSKRQNNSE